MRNISRNIRTSTKAGTSFPATVIDTVGDKVTVRLSNRGAVYRNLQLVGGPVDIGEHVFVDMTTPEPTVIAPGKDYETRFEELELKANKNWPVLAEAEMPEEDEDVDSGFIEVYLEGEWASSGSAGSWWKDPTSGSFFDVTEAGMDAACEYATPGSAIFFPEAVLHGNFLFWYDVALIGRGLGKSVLMGQQSFRHSHYVRDITLIHDYDEPNTQAAVVVYGDGYWHNTAIVCTNAQSGSGAYHSGGIMSYLMSANLVMDNVYIEADRGIWGNPFPYSAEQPSYIFGVWLWDGTPPWYVQYNTSGSNNLRFHGEDSFGGTYWMVDGFIIYVYSRLYDKPDGATVYVKFEALNNGHGETNLYSNAANNGHVLGDESFYNELPPAGGSGSTGLNPTMPYTDESDAYMVDGSQAWSNYGPGNMITWKWENQFYGLGSDPNSGSAGEYSPRTEIDDSYLAPEYSWVWLTRYMGAWSGGDPRLNQNGYDLDLFFKYAWVEDEKGWKEWIAPTIFRAKLLNCSFKCEYFEVWAPYYSLIIADPLSYYRIVNYAGVVVLDSTMGAPDFSSTEPSLPYPGMFWYPMDDYGG